MKRLTFAVMTLTVLLFCSGCGTLFFSHRIGKKLSKTVDNRVFYTNCFLCLCGIIPGVVAFILDYDNGSIYYTEAELLPDDFLGMKKNNKLKSISCRSMTFAEIADLLSAELDRKITPEQIETALKEQKSFELL